MDAARYIDVFNNKMSDFISDLQRLANANPLLSNEVSMLSTSTKMARNLNPRTPCEMFYRLVTQQYADQIQAEDESFFLSKSYDQEVSNQGLVETVKKMWSSLASDDKSAVTAHLKLLVAISKKVFE